MKELRNKQERKLTSARRKHDRDWKKTEEVNFGKPKLY